MKLLNLFNWVESLVGFFTLNVGGGGGGGNQPQTSTSYSTNLPEYAKPYYEELLKQTGKQIYNTDDAGKVTGVKSYTPYPGERIAGFTPGQETIQRETMGLGLPSQFGQSRTGLTTGQAMGFGTGAAGLGQAFGYSPMAISGGTFDAPAASYYMSPYQTGVTDIAAVLNSKDIRDIILKTKSFYKVYDVSSKVVKDKNMDTLLKKLNSNNLFVVQKTDGTVLYYSTIPKTEAEVIKVLNKITKGE